MAQGTSIGADKLKGICLDKASREQGVTASEISDEYDTHPGRTALTLNALGRKGKVRKTEFTRKGKYIYMAADNDAEPTIKDDTPEPTYKPKSKSKPKPKPKSKKEPESDVSDEDSVVSPPKETSKKSPRELNAEMSEKVTEARMSAHNSGRILGRALHGICKSFIEGLTEEFESHSG